VIGGETAADRALGHLQFIPGDREFRL
jgi:hypothetical protein